MPLQLAFINIYCCLLYIRVVDFGMQNEFQIVMRSHLSDNFLSDFYKQSNNYSYEISFSVPKKSSENI